MLTKTPESQAAEYANGILNALNQILTRAQALTTNGAPGNANLGSPAVTAESITTALGPVNLEVIRLITTAARTHDLAKLNQAIEVLAQ